jgi:menaquinone-dependent protoporphyrinogen IX oxidase
MQINAGKCQNSVYVVFREAVLTWPFSFSTPRLKVTAARLPNMSRPSLKRADTGGARRLARTRLCVPGSFDGIDLCAPIHIGRYPIHLIQFCTDWKEALDAVPTHSSRFLSPSPATARKSAPRRKAYPAKLEKKTGFPLPKVHHAAGALKYLEYDFFKRMMMRQIAKPRKAASVDTSRDHEFTDWKALDRFVQRVLRSTWRRRGRRSLGNLSGKTVPNGLLRTALLTAVFPLSTGYERIHSCFPGRRAWRRQPPCHRAWWLPCWQGFGFPWGTMLVNIARLALPWGF